MRRLVAHLHDAREAEYRHIIKILEDEILSPLVGVSMDLGGIRGHRARGAAVQGVQDATRAAARLKARLVPALVIHCGLGAAFAAAARDWRKNHRTDCRTTVDEAEAARVGPVLRLEFFRLFEEGVSVLLDVCGPGPLEISLGNAGGSWRLLLRMETRRPEMVRVLNASPGVQSARERVRRQHGTMVIRCSRRFVSVTYAVPAAA